MQNDEGKFIEWLLTLEPYIQSSFTNKKDKYIIYMVVACNNIVILMTQIYHKTLIDLYIKWNKWNYSMTLGG